LTRIALGGITCIEFISATHALDFREVDNGILYWNAKSLESGDVSDSISLRRPST
jgi:hypothetical protein